MSNNSPPGPRLRLVFTSVAPPRRLVAARRPPRLSAIAGCQPPRLSRLAAGRGPLHGERLWRQTRRCFSPGRRNCGQCGLVSVGGMAGVYDWQRRGGVAAVARLAMLVYLFTYCGNAVCVCLCVSTVCTCA